ncbi:response regulator transcription factor [Oscillochloris sp. ZM17-4]|uniref:response regulator transcription factor n=1 Tax=Oscillochloris sp. ZM17-4 TaxID=2866714 RepID=UPI001C732E97|nr:response regulator transcription factor [Oscillochloris sp. ZM17-4]MBX0328084.1 response regulator transcription factor [Oscillochloris sp. ZM17-4]
MESSRVLVVDDETLVRRVLGDALRQAGYRVYRAASRAEALTILEETGADLMLLDLQLGDDDGVEVMRTARSRWPNLPIIILTAHGSMSSAIEAVRNDAADYLLKPIRMDVLKARVADILDQHRVSQQRTERIRTMYEQLQALVEDEGLDTARGAAPQPTPSASLRAGPLMIDVQQHVARMDGQPVDLTPTEFAILYAMVRQPGVVISCNQLIQSFQSSQMDEDEARTVMRPHIVRLRRKLEPDPHRPQYIQSVRGIGYRWSDTDDQGGDER